MRFGALVLAAGFSRRLGRPKQDVLLAGESLLDRAVRTAQQAGLDPVLAVVREAHWMGRLMPLGVTVLLNEQAQQGMATSVVLGVRWAEQAKLDGLLILTCDQPGLTPRHLQRLYADPMRITASRYAGRNGVPAYFTAASFPSLLQLRGDAGARSLLAGAESIEDEALALDIDTEEDLRAAQRGLGHLPMV